MARILVVEDHPDVRALVVEHLTGEGHEVLAAGNGSRALDLLATGVDLVVLDLMLPVLDGTTVLRAMRNTGPTPVLVLSARDSVETKIELLREGADDYLTKPFDLGELSARVDVLLRRSQPTAHTPAVLRHGPLALETAAARVTVDQVEVPLTGTELAILRALLEAPGTVLTKASLHEQVWGEPFGGDDASLKAHVSNLRRKLRRAGAPEDLVQTVWGLGYRLCRLSSHLRLHDPLTPCS